MGSSSPVINPSGVLTNINVTGQFLAKLGFTDYHCVASGTNYTREWINSKIS